MKSLKSSKKEERVLVISDLHIPFEDKGLVELVVFDFGKDFKPDTIILNGDVVDNYSLSRYLKIPSKSQPLEVELLEAEQFLRRLRAAFPAARIIYVFGNHEFRLEAKLLSLMPELYTTLGLESLLHLEELRIEVVHEPYKENFWMYHEWAVGHFDKAVGNAGATAMSLLRNKGCSVVQAHTHRCGVSYITGLTETMIGIESGCLCILDGTYILKPNWQHGFVYGFHTDKGTSMVPVPIIKRGFYFGLKHYVSA